MGNHEEVMLKCADGDQASYGPWLQFGGLQTLESYGITREDIFQPWFELARAMRVMIPPEHLEFIRSFKDHITIGDYLFVHAGIRPGRPIDEQSVRDLRWIRTGFLDSKADHGLMVVHGHTITPTAERHANRIAIDTGCYSTGRLSALAIEGDHVELLTITE
jgi:serine/threonine protein phosphatase 1